MTDTDITVSRDLEKWLNTEIAKAERAMKNYRMTEPAHWERCARRDALKDVLNQLAIITAPVAS